MDRDTPEDLREAVRRTVEENGPMVTRWMEAQPGSWGQLAGKAVLSYRQRVGTLTDLDRRLVWQELWVALNQLRSSATRPSD